MNALTYKDLIDLKSTIESSSIQFSKEGYRAVMLTAQWRALGANLPKDISDTSMVSLAENGSMFVNGVEQL